MQFTIEFQDQHLQQVLKAVNAELISPTQMLTSVGESLLRVNKDRHLEAKAPDGTDWAELAKSTKAEKRKGKALNKTGEMLESFNYQVTSDTLVLGFDGQRNAQLAIWHHEGTDPYLIEPLNKKALAFGGGFYKKVNHPGLEARPLVGYPLSDQQLTVDVIEDHLTYILNKVK